MSAFTSMGFAGNPLDRLSERRDDARALSALWESDGARAVAFVGAMPLLHSNGDGLAALHGLRDIRALAPAAEPVLLGRDGTGPVYGFQLPESVLVRTPAGDGDGLADHRQAKIDGRPDLIVGDLRTLAAANSLTAAEAAILAQAKAVLHWHATHGFCPRCGARTNMAQAGWRRDCPSCGLQHFPRTDPVVIVMVTHGDDCLMGRQKAFPAGMYSCLAGFVESGETLAEAARREIFEESGVRLGDVRVIASQPWPFPSSLMIGCRGQALSRGIKMDEAELEDCRWFSREEARAMIAGLHPENLQAPHPIAIARRMLDHWLAEG
jgi:NAD+ diphosphatase